MKIAKCFRTVGTILIIIVILLCVPLVLPKMLGYQVCEVVTGSMEPELQVGSVVYIEKCDANQIKVGDIISFYVGIDEENIISHRVVEIKENESFVTKGDSNNYNDDSTVDSTHLIGKVKFKINNISWLVHLFDSITGIIIVCGIIVISLFLNISSDILDRSISKEKNDKDGLKNEPSVDVNSSSSQSNSTQSNSIQSNSTRSNSTQSDSIQSNNAKRNDTKKKYNYVLGGIGCVLIVISIVNICNIIKDYNSSNELYDKLNKDYIIKNEESVKDSESYWYNDISVDFDELSSVNKDIAGWIYFENNDISYPVMYSGDDETYLRKSFDGTKSIAGSIFMEGINNPEFTDGNTIIYGHNMRNLSMFGLLKKYIRDDKYYDSNKYFQIITPNCAYRYLIFAYETVDEDSGIYQISFNNDSDFESYIDTIRTMSEKKTDVDVQSGDKIVTLSTCSTISSDKRFVVHAVRVDEHAIK